MRSRATGDSSESESRDTKYVRYGDICFREDERWFRGGPLLHLHNKCISRQFLNSLPTFQLAYIQQNYRIHEIQLWHLVFGFSVATLRNISGGATEDEA